MLHIGFTGTRHGMTEAQKRALRQFVREIVPVPSYASHGDCIGADAQFHDIVGDETDAFTYARPGRHETSPLRANCAANVVMPVKHPIARNRDIVAESTHMIAAPSMSSEFDGNGRRATGGTWTTVRLAREADKPLAIVWPDGSVTKERWP